MSDESGAPRLGTILLTVAAAAVVLKGTATALCHYQYRRADAAVAELQHLIASNPALLLPPPTVIDASHGAARVLSEGGTAVPPPPPLLFPGGSSAAPLMLTDAAAAASPETPSSSSAGGGGGGAPTPPPSATARRGSTVRILSVTTTQPGRWRKQEGPASSAAAESALDRVVNRVHLFAQPRWALAPCVSPAGTAVEGYMRARKIPYTLHTVRLLTPGEPPARTSAADRTREDEAEEAEALAHPEAAGILRPPPAGEEAEEEAGEKDAPTLAGVPLPPALAAVVKMWRVVRARLPGRMRRRQLPYLVYCGQVVEGTAERLLDYLEEHFPHTLVTGAEDEEGEGEAAEAQREEDRAVAQAVRQTLGPSFSLLYHLALVEGAPAVYSRYAAQALGVPGAAMRLWLLAPWLSGVRGQLRRDLARHTTLRFLTAAQRERTLLNDIAALEALVADAADRLRRPFLGADPRTPAAHDCLLFGFLAPLMQLTERDRRHCGSAALRRACDSAVLRAYTERVAAAAFPNLHLLAAQVTGEPAHQVLARRRGTRPSIGSGSPPSAAGHRRRRASSTARLRSPTEEDGTAAAAAAAADGLPSSSSFSSAAAAAAAAAAAERERSLGRGQPRTALAGVESEAARRDGGSSELRARPSIVVLPSPDAEVPPPPPSLPTRAKSEPAGGSLKKPQTQEKPTLVVSAAAAKPKARPAAAADAQATPQTDVKAPQGRGEEQPHAQRQQQQRPETAKDSDDAPPPSQRPSTAVAAKSAPRSRSLPATRSRGASTVTHAAPPTLGAGTSPSASSRATVHAAFDDAPAAVVTDAPDAGTYAALSSSSIRKARPSRLSTPLPGTPTPDTRPATTTSTSTTMPAGAAPAEGSAAASHSHGTAGNTRSSGGGGGGSSSSSVRTTTNHNTHLSGDRRRTSQSHTNDATNSKAQASIAPEGASHSTHNAGKAAAADGPKEPAKEGKRKVKKGTAKGVSPRP